MLACGEHADFITKIKSFVNKGKHRCLFQDLANLSQNCISRKADTKYFNMLIVIKV